jgi:hypothetical protein
MPAAFAAPDEHHAALRRLTGAWSAQIRYFEAPDAPPVERTGEFLARLDLGGYFLFRQINFGMQGFQGHGVTGWDPFKKSYVGTWADSESPVIYGTEGAFDERGNVFTETSEGPDADGTMLRLLMITEIVDDTHATYRMFRTDRGSHELQVEILLTRRRFV